MLSFLTLVITMPEENVYLKHTGLKYLFGAKLSVRVNISMQYNATVHGSRNDTCNL